MPRRDRAVERRVKGQRRAHRVGPGRLLIAVAECTINAAADASATVTNDRCTRGRSILSLCFLSPASAERY